MFGPIGAVVGVIVGTVASSINLGVKYAQRERAYAHELFKDDSSRAYNLARAGDMLLTGRLR